MYTHNGEKLDVLIDRLRANKISDELIDKFRKTLIINFKSIDGYICTRKNYTFVWEQIGHDLILEESKGIGIVWFHDAHPD